jgi:4-amino-4-deoxy-L-arabinose transferase-like glycosyltransferase
VEPQPAAKQLPYAPILILAVSVIAFFLGLGTLGLLGPDEPRYAEVAREMFVSGDYISTRLCGCLWFEKPALLYWLSAAGYHLFGVTEFAARVATATAALATALIVYLSLKGFGQAREGLCSAIVLTTSGIFVAYARVATPDMVLTASITASLLSAYYSLHRTGWVRTAFLSLAFAFMALAVLAKGLVGLVLVFAIFGAFLFLSGDLRRLRIRDLSIGVLVFLVVAATWYGPVMERHGWQFVEEFFVRHHFQRYTSNEFGHPQPIYFFPIVGIAGIAPWTFFLIPAATRLRTYTQIRDSVLALAWIWAIVPVLFFSFSESKLPGYILPAFPALAIIVGSEIDRFLRGESSKILLLAAWMTAITLVGIGVGFIIYTRSEAIRVSSGRGLLAYLPCCVAIITIATLVARKRRAFITSSVGVVICSIVTAVILLFPVLRNEVSLKELSLEAGAALKPGEKIGFYLKKEFAPVFYADGRVLCEPKRGGTFYALHQDMLADALENESSLIVITDSKWLPGIENDPRFTTERIGVQGDALAVRVTMKKVVSGE